MKLDNARDVLENGQILDVIVSFQDGVPQELQWRLRERYDTILLPHSFRRPFERLPSNFRQLQSFPDRVIDLSGGPNGLFVQDHVGDHRNCRFGLHLAIAEGELEVVQMFYKHKPELFSPRAICCALNFKQYQVALWLCPILKELHKGISENQEVAGQFKLHENYKDGRRKIVEWYFCMDALGFSIPFKNGATLERSDVETHIESIKSCQEALETKNIEDFKTALEDPSMVYIHELDAAFTSTINSGKIDFIDLILKKACKEIIINSEVPYRVAMTGNLELFEWFGENYGWYESLCNGFTMKSLIEIGNISALRWLRNHLKSRWPDFEIDEPVKVADEGMIQFLHEIQFPLNQVWPLSVEVAQFLIDHKVKVTRQHILWAVGGERGDEEYGLEDTLAYRKNLAQICKLYHSHCRGVVFTLEDIILGLILGAKEFVQFVHESKIEGLNEAQICLALQMGHFEMVKYMHEVLEWPMPPSGLGLAIRSGGRVEEIDHKKLPLLQYVVESNKDMVWTVNDEPANCVYETLQWLLLECEGLGNGKIFASCVRFSSVEVLEFVFKHTSPSIQNVEAALNNALRTKSMTLLEYLWNLLVSMWQKNGNDISNECKEWMSSVNDEDYEEYSGRLWHSFLAQICSTQTQYAQ